MYVSIHKYWYTKINTDYTKINTIESSGPAPT